jgi:hypothetical protein
MEGQVEVHFVFLGHAWALWTRDIMDFSVQPVDVWVNPNSYGVMQEEKRWFSQEKLNIASDS